VKQVIGKIILRDALYSGIERNHTTMLR